jgi:hypothetical protein
MKATRSGNARIHGMTRVTRASLAYIATQVPFLSLLYIPMLIPCHVQVRFSLSSTAAFSRADTITDSQRFYNSVFDIFNDVEESDEVNELISWWNRYELIIIIWNTSEHLDESRQIFPHYCENPRPLNKTSALVRIKAKRAALRSTQARSPGATMD